MSNNHDWLAQIAPYMDHAGRFEPLSGVHQKDCLINLQSYFGEQWRAALDGKWGVQPKLACQMIVATHRYFQRAKRIDDGQEMTEESRKALIERMRRQFGQ